MKNGQKKGILSFVYSFSKAITVIWLIVWIETIFFSQAATLFNFGDALSIQYVLETVTEIGVIVSGFYFSSKTIENVAKGIEQHRIDMHDKKQNNCAQTDNSDSDTIPLE